MTFENFVREHKTFNFNWNNISQNSQLSEDLIREFKDKVKWTKISQHQRLSEKFIEEMAEYVNWSKIAQYQTLSEEFKKKYAKKLKVRKARVKKIVTEPEYYEV